MEIDNIYNIDCAKGIKQLPKGYKYCIVTDPPFNVGYHYNTYSDNKPESEYYKWLEDITKDFPCVIIHYPESLYKFALQTRRAPNRVISWVYNSNTPRQHRDIAFFDIEPNFNNVRQPYKNPADKRIAERIARGIEGGRLYDWIEENQVKNVSKAGAIIHPCQMPLELMRKIIALLPPDVVILEPFLGSGTTALAAIMQNRHYIGFEIDAQYYRLASERIKAETQQLKLF